MEPCADQCRESPADGGLGIDQVSGDAQVTVDGLPGDEEPHDLTGPLEDQVDAGVSEAPFQWIRIFTPLTQ